MARRLLTFAKPQAAAPRAVRAAEAVARARQMARGIARGRVEVVERVAADAGAVHIDPVMLEQVLTNLAINAIDAMPEGGVLTFEASAAQLPAPRDGVGPAAGPYVRFAVSDTGAGMEEPTMARIFEPFFTTKASTRGTGLGLSTSYSIVSQAGGRITVSSVVGVGTRFEVLLPEVGATEVP
jgi:two-component system cell cycle sensor histidine kinase/response regulator CckA